MRKGTFYIVSTPYGMCGPYTWAELDDYVQEWWADMVNGDTDIDPMPTTPGERIEMYFDISSHLGLDYYDEFTIDENWVEVLFNES